MNFYQKKLIERNKEIKELYTALENLHKTVIMVDSIAWSIPNVNARIVLDKYKNKA